MLTYCSSRSVSSILILKTWVDLWPWRNQVQNMDLKKVRWKKQGHCYSKREEARQPLLCIIEATLSCSWQKTENGGNSTFLISAQAFLLPVQKKISPIDCSNQLLIASMYIRHLVANSHQIQTLVALEPNWYLNLRFDVLNYYERVDLLTRFPLTHCTNLSLYGV